MQDTSPVDTQIESSLSFVSAAKLKTSTPFLGRDALIEQKSRGVRRRLVNFRVNDASATLWGHERVFRDGMDVGHITSGGISFLDEENSRAIGLGFVSCDEGECVTKSYLSQGKFHVEVVDVEHGKTRLVQCTPSLSCLYVVLFLFTFSSQYLSLYLINKYRVSQVRSEGFKNEIICFIFILLRVCD